MCSTACSRRCDLLEAAVSKNTHELKSECHVRHHLGGASECVTASVRADTVSHERDNREYEC